MATYILLLTLTPEGRARALQDSDFILSVGNAIEDGGVQTLGLYAVLGHYDFVTLVEAPSNEAVARFSLELGVRAGVHIETLPVIPASRLEDGVTAASAEAEQPAPAPGESRRPTVPQLRTQEIARQRGSNRA